jgi:monothiol glutaredoxin
VRIINAMTEPSLKDKVEELIRENQVLLFMKGTPDAPQCGFSMRVVNVLETYGVEYAALDVLPALQPLREVTAEISDWQTFPQLYVNGKLVGGCDIIEEMDESGELAGVLGAEQPERPATSATQELQADPQQSPPIQIDR